MDEQMAGGVVGVGDAGLRARHVQGPRRRLRGPPLHDPQGEGGEVGGGDQGAARPRRRERADPCRPPQRPAPALPHPRVAPSIQFYSPLASSALPRHLQQRQTTRRSICTRQLPDSSAF